MMLVTVCGLVLTIGLVNVSAIPGGAYVDEGDCASTTLHTDCTYEGIDDDCSVQVGPGTFYTYYECSLGKKKCSRSCTVDFERDPICAFAASRGDDMLISTSLCSSPCGVGSYTVTYNCHGKPVECRYRCCCKPPPCEGAGDGPPKLGLPCSDYVDDTSPEACTF